MNQLEQQINSLQLNHEGEVRRTVKKIGPTVPPKPKKSQPEVRHYSRKIKRILFNFEKQSIMLLQRPHFQTVCVKQLRKTSFTSF